MLSSSYENDQIEMLQGQNEGKTPYQINESYVKLRYRNPNRVYAQNKKEENFGRIEILPFCSKNAQKLFWKNFHCLNIEFVKCS